MCIRDRVATEGVGIYGETPEEYLCRMEMLGELMAILDTCTEAVSYTHLVILTGTEFLTMNTRPKIPANARNLNACVIGSSGSGKTDVYKRQA